MYSPNAFCTLLVLCPCLLLLEAKRDFTIDLYTLNISVADRTLVKSANYHLYGTKIIYLDFILTRSLNDFGLKASVDMIRKDNRYMNVFKMDTHGCDALKSSHDKMNLLKVIFREIFRVSNIPRKCPIAANKKYFINNFTLREDDFPPIFPSLEFQMKIEISVDRDEKATGIIKGRIRK
ncbi:uncharacterized protein LOC109613655 [Musca domestica]|uniref:Uncharacterized protein LOC109613655 n=1 Tax=Musca domestica TaxID=7370 RepID=A0A9J7IFH1_MUSDO|nr:uncharacterized protein LOC109613655 [Musca domestica]